MSIVISTCRSSGPMLIGDVANSEKPNKAILWTTNQSFDCMCMYLNEKAYKNVIKCNNGSNAPTSR